MPDLLSQLKQARVIDLAQPWFVGMPHYPTHPPYLYSLTKQHGEIVLPGGGSSAADAIAMGTHVGTHIDALCHFSCLGSLYGGVPVEDQQSYTSGLSHLPVDQVAPIVQRGVLLDIANAVGVDVLPEDFVITPAELDAAAARQGIKVEAGDVVLLRTGWSAYWNNPGRFINELRTPGPELEGARWLSERKVFAAGSDTAAFERVPSPRMAVHVHLLVESGIHIIEALNLDQLAAERRYEFVFVAAPLRLRGATGSPIRPLAFCS